MYGRSRTHESTEEDGEGENEKMRRQGGRISDGEIRRMTLKKQAKNRTVGGGEVDYQRHII